MPASVSEIKFLISSSSDNAESKSAKKFIHIYHYEMLVHYCNACSE